MSVTTTVATPAQAQELGRSLVAQRLAACVQVEPGLQSFYRWENKPCDEAEVRLTIKTLGARLDALQAFFAEHHPYDVPQFLAVTMQASEPYAAWVRQAVAPSS